MTWRAVVVALTWALAVAQVSRAAPPGLLNAQSLNRPIFRPEADVPSGTVHGLAFHEDAEGRLWLFCGGEDKVVRKWRIPLAGSQPFALELAEKIRWPIQIGQTGWINDVAIGHGYLAFGGAGMIPSQVECLYLDATESRSRLLRSEDKRDPSQRVFSLDFHPEKPLLAVGHQGDPASGGDAHVFLWQVDRGEATVVDSLQTDLHYADFVRFSPTGTHVALAEGSSGRLRVWNLAAKSAKQDAAFPNLASPLGGLKWLDGETIAAASHNGVQQVGLNGKNPVAILPETVAKAAAIATDRETGHVAVGGQIAAGEKPYGVVLGRWRDGKVQQVPLRDTGFSGQVMEVAFSPDGKYIAAVGEDDYDSIPGASGIELRLWSVGSGELLAQFPSENDRTVQAGAPIAELAYTKNDGDEEAIVFTRREGNEQAIRFQLSFPRELSRVKRPAELERQPTINLARRGNLHWQKKNKETEDAYWTFTIQSQGREIGPIPLLRNELQMGAPRIGLPFESGGESFVAIAYEYGILVWNLEKFDGLQPGKGDPSWYLGWAIARGFTGHEGKVTSLDVADDGSWLISGSEDGTISAWNLAGITDDRSGRELGIQFAQKNGKLVVEKVEPYSEGFLAGFRSRQQILEGAIADRSYSDKFWRYWMERPVPGLRYDAEVRAPGKGGRAPIWTTAMQRPLWTFYPLLDNRNWVMWAPSGHFDASDEGARFMGWHINRFAEDNQEAAFVRFFSGELFRGRFYEPLAFDKLLKQRNRKVFLAAVDHKPAYLGLQLPPKVAITHVTNKGGTAVRPGEELTAPQPLNNVEVDIEVPESTRLTGAELWCNSRLVAKLAIEQPGTYTFRPPNGRNHLIGPGDLRTGQNSIIAVVQGKTQDGTLVYGVPYFHRFRVARGQPDANVHYVGVGVTRLDHAAAWKDHSIAELDYTGNDAYYLGQKLEKVVDGSPYFNKGSFQYLLDAGDLPAGAAQAGTTIREPRQETIQQALQELNGVSADDLVVILLSGHGFDEQGLESAGIGKGNRGHGFYFVTKDTAPAMNKALTRDAIHERLQELPCKTLLLVDACHAGGVDSNRALRAASGLSLGPQILVSCRDYELSLEHSRARFDGEKPVGQGVFTAALIEALTQEQLKPNGKAMESLPQRDLNADGNRAVTVMELCSFVKRRVPRLRQDLAQAGGRGGRPKQRDQQNPVAISTDTFPIEKTPLFQP